MVESSYIVCERCGSRLGSQAGQPICIKCLLLDGLTDTADALDLANETLTDDRVTPHLIGTHEILGEIAHGGMGIIYRARDRRLDRTVAIKMLLLGPYAGQEAIERFRREANAAAALQHPNIVRILEVGEAEGQP